MKRIVMTTLEMIEKKELIQCPDAICKSFEVGLPCVWSPEAWDKLGWTSPLLHIAKALKTHPDNVLFKWTKKGDRPNTTGVFKDQFEGKEIEYRITFGWTITQDPEEATRIITVHMPGE